MVQKRWAGLLRAPQPRQTTGATPTRRLPPHCVQKRLMALFMEWQCGQVSQLPVACGLGAGCGGRCPAPSGSPQEEQKRWLALLGWAQRGQTMVG